MSNKIKPVQLFLLSGDPIDNPYKESIVNARHARREAQETREQLEHAKTIRRRRVVAVGAGAIIAAILISVGTGYKSNRNSANAKSNITEQPAFTIHQIKPGETLEEVASDDLNNRSTKQMFAEEPTASEIDVREFEIAADSDVKDINKIQAGKVLKLPNNSEVPVRFKQPD